MKVIKRDEKEEIGKQSLFSEGFFSKERVLAAALVILVSTIFVAPVSAVDHHVYAGDSIQAAINAANPYDTIIVHDGTYNENVIVNKSDI